MALPAAPSSVSAVAAAVLAGGSAGAPPPSLDDALSYWVGLAQLVHRVCVTTTPAASPTTGGTPVSPCDDSSGGSAPLHLTRHTLHGVLLCCGIKQHRVRQTVDHMLAHLLSSAYTSTGTSSSSDAASAAPVVLLDADSAGATPARQLPVPLSVLVADWLALSAAVDEHDAAGRHRYRLCVPAASWQRSIVKCLSSELRGQMLSLRPLLRWNVACAQQTGRTPVVLFLGGTSGAGKSTLASLVASQLRIPTVLSTDTVRQVLRSRLRGRAAQYPALFASTYEAHKAVLGAGLSCDALAGRVEGGAAAAAVHLAGANTGTVEERGAPAAAAAAVATAMTNMASVVAAYEAQCELVLQALDGVLARLLARRESVVVEGVHLLPRYVAAKRAELLVAGVACVPALVRIPKADSHLERFCVRARGMSMHAPSNKYIASFQAIRTIQAHLVDSVHAASLPVLVLSNTNVDKSFTVLHYALLETMEHAAVHGWPVDAAAAAEVPLTALAFTAVKHRLVAVVRQRREPVGPSSGSPSTSGAGALAEDSADAGARRSPGTDVLGVGLLPLLLSATGCPVDTDTTLGCSSAAGGGGGEGGCSAGSAARARSAELLGAVQRRVLEQGAGFHHQLGARLGGSRAEAVLAGELTSPLGGGLASPAPATTMRGLRGGKGRSSCHSAHLTARRTSRGSGALAHLDSTTPSRRPLEDGSEDFDEAEMPSLLGS